MKYTKNIASFLAAVHIKVYYHLGKNLLTTSPSASLWSDESGENKQDTTIPVPAPIKKSTIDFLYGCLIFDFLYS